MPSADTFDVTVALDYYAPYVSGLTEAARLTAEGLANRGWNVAVACARHSLSLPRYEKINGVHVYRAPVLARVRKGILSPTLPRLAAQLAARSALLHLHLPMPEAAFVVRLRPDRPLVTTYHIDAFLRDGLVNRLGMKLADLSAADAMRRADVIVVNSTDQAHGSRLWPVIRHRPLCAIPSPCVDRAGGAPAFREGTGTHIGFMGRVAEEKGIEYLIRAFRGITDSEARLLIAGDYETVAGGSNIVQLRAEAGDDPRIRFLGLLRGQRIRDFYASIDVFALPSIAESFGIVQVEAMMTGVPSVVTDLPGARYPVQATGFGRVVPPREPAAVRQAVLELAALPAITREAGRRRTVELFGGDGYLDAYEKAFRQALASHDAGAGPGTASAPSH
ncbi:MAG TPA: glycosyltransferase family 4 protein [Micromonosporaceae bacterium]|jgi:glycosyltransferase involved in cell wall biosynthesis|nr:glycosyltransferase family 4 protein [Micromonosporaceae bacterium]